MGGSISSVSIRNLLRARSMLGTEDRIHVKGPSGRENGLKREETRGYLETFAVIQVRTHGMVMENYSRGGWEWMDPRKI